MAATMEVGPFTWTRRRDASPEEVWVLTWPSDEARKAFGTHFVLKDYGAYERDDSFSGWRLVSGGPFLSAGKWRTRDEAMERVVPYLTKFVRERAEEKRIEYEVLLAALPAVSTLDAP